MVRVRFAPSPTGELHIGGARTALYNFLFARQQKGKFIIRIEDTDQERFVPGSLDRLLSGLKWLGLTWDEGPDVGGEYGPYVQSERLDLYHQYTKELLAHNSAYYCFCTSQRLEELRQAQQANNLPTRYDRACLKLTADEIKKKLTNNEPYTIRLQIPEGTTTFTDLVRGLVSMENNTLDDQILLKSDGFPTYHLACVVDDHAMNISHVIRGEEWLPSTPKHLLLYKAFGWESPIFAHLPNVLNDKKAKLSKRRDGEIVWVQTYEKQGYLSEALANFLALLGWHPTDDRELFDLAQLINEFQLNRVQKGGAIFNRKKLDWFNAEYIKKMTLDELDIKLQPFYKLLVDELKVGLKDTKRLTTILQTRLILLSDVKTLATWFFLSHLQFDSSLLIPKDGSKEKTLATLTRASVLLSEVGEWNIIDIKALFDALVNAKEYTRMELLWPMRVALTGEKYSPDVFEVAWVLGQEETLVRLKKAVAMLSV